MGQRGPQPGGQRIGGRARGTLNKSTVLAQHALQTVQERLLDLRCDPLAVVVALVQDADVELEVRARYATELLRYLYPKLSNIEVVDDRATTSDFLMLREIVDAYQAWKREQGLPLAGELPDKPPSDPYRRRYLFRPPPAESQPATNGTANGHPKKNGREE